MVSIPLDGLSRPAWFYTFNGLGNENHFAVRIGEPSGVPLVRVHSECVTGDVFGSQRCDCGAQLRKALEVMDRESGWCLYMRQEGRGIGLVAKLDAYRLQDAGIDTFEANRRLGFRDDERDYEDAADMLRALGLDSVRLLTGNPEKASALCGLGIRVCAILPCDGSPTAHNQAYLRAKRARHERLPASRHVAGVPQLIA